MSKGAAYAKLLRVPSIGALGIVPVIAALTMGITDFYPLFLIFIIYSNQEYIEMKTEFHDLGNL